MVMGLPAPFHVYSLCHAGPSHDHAARLRPLIVIQQRGRWKTRSFLVRYEKQSRMQAEFDSLPTATKGMCLLCRKFLLEFFLAPNAAPLHPQDAERARVALLAVPRR